MIKTVFIVGPTGIGKTKYAIDYALSHDGEIVSADSMQLYKYMNIGSAKPTNEERSLVKHYLVDEIDPRNSFNVFDYQKLALSYIKQIHDKGKLPIVCGGTGLYVNALVYDMDFSAPAGDLANREKIFERFCGNAEKLHAYLKSLDENAANEIHPNNIKRVIRAIERIENGEGEFKSFSSLNKKSTILEPEIFNLSMDRSKLYDRINNRVDNLYEQGLVDEVKGLMEQGFTSDDFAMKGIGYKEIIDALNLGYSAESAKDLIKQNTRHFAKRQITWFKRYKEAKIVEL